jgi:hypothetical protein
VRFKLWWIGFGGALVVFGPNVAYLIDEFQRFSGRGNHVLIWTEEAWRHLSLKYQSGGSVWIVLKEQILRAALAPFYFPDESTICYLRRPIWAPWRPPASRSVSASVSDAGASRPARFPSSPSSPCWF